MRRLLNFSNKVQFNISSYRHFYHGKSHTVGMGSLSGIQRCAVCRGKSVSTSRYSPEPFFMDVHPNFVISNSTVRYRVLLVFVAGLSVFVAVFEFFAKVDAAHGGKPAPPPPPPGPPLPPPGPPPPSPPGPAAAPPAACQRCLLESCGSVRSQRAACEARPAANPSIRLGLCGTHS